jgi:hypothetical protein
MCSDLFTSSICNPNSPWETVETQSNRLDSWHRELPENVKLQHLLNAGDIEYSLSERSSLLVVHVVYLTARLIAYKRKFETCGVLEVARIPETVLDTCTQTARQIGWTISLLSRHGPFLRCWLVK